MQEDHDYNMIILPIIKYTDFFIGNSSKSLEMFVTMDREKEDV